VSAGDGSWTIRDGAVGETYHPELGIVAECRAWLEQPEIAEVLAREGTVRVWDVGLGAGGVAAALLERLRGRRAELASFERSTSLLAAVLEEPDFFPHLAVLSRELWQRRLEPGPIDVGGCSWSLILGDITETMTDWAERPPDLVMYDMHSPKAQPELWGLEFWEKRAAEWQGARVLVAFHTRSTAVRSTLLGAGFFVGVGAGLGGKEETTLAGTASDLILRPLDPRWLERLERSTSGSPIRGHGYATGSIPQEDLDRIRRHPQFARGTQD